MIIRFPLAVTAGLAIAALLPGLATASPRPATATATATLQQRLQDLHFPTGPVDGRPGPALIAAVTAFQRADGLVADGVAGPATLAALRHPVPLIAGSHTPGRHVEVDVTRQLMEVVDDGAVTRAYAVSTGMRGHDTPLGTFRIGRKELRSWSVPYHVWMPYASYFSGGVAFHAGGTSVARSSHGCVHVPAAFASDIYNLLVPGTVVLVRA